MTSRRRAVAAACVLIGLALGFLAPANAEVTDTGPVSVRGQVATPATYTRAELDALPEFTVDARTATDAASAAYTGPSLEGLVAAAAPTLPATGRNLPLRVSVEVASTTGETLTIAYGELLAMFGNRRGILALERDGTALDAPKLVMPDTVPGARSLGPVASITVAVRSPAATTPPAGGVNLRVGDRTVTLSAADIAALPQQGSTVTFTAAGTPQSRTEVGPTLAAVLRRAAIRPADVAFVAATAGADGYTAVVTPLESTVGTRPLSLSVNEQGTALAQPRLIVDGDVAGGRYVTGVTDMLVGCVPLTQCDTLAGVQGPQGPGGDQGPTGGQGPTGDQGPIGGQGPTGGEGPTGGQGPVGTGGPTGAAGPTGAVGPQGGKGPVGSAGPQGTAGPQGPAGPRGAAGDKGPRGNAGRVRVTCKVRKRGARRVRVRCRVTPRGAAAGVRLVSGGKVVASGRRSVSARVRPGVYRAVSGRAKTRLVVR